MQTHRYMQSAVVVGVEPWGECGGHPGLSLRRPFLSHSDPPGIPVRVTAAHLHLSLSVCLCLYLSLTRRPHPSSRGGRVSCTVVCTTSLIARCDCPARPRRVPSPTCTGGRTPRRRRRRTASSPPRRCTTTCPTTTCWTTWPGNRQLCRIVLNQPVLPHNVRTGDSERFACVWLRGAGRCFRTALP